MVLRRLTRNQIPSGSVGSSPTVRAASGFFCREVLNSILYSLANCEEIFLKCKLIFFQVIEVGKSQRVKGF